MTAPNSTPQRRQNTRNWAVFLALAGFAGLIYAVTIVRITLGYLK